MRPPYAQYKSSGVEWLGEVPEHWQWSQTRHLFDIVNGGTPVSSEENYWDGDIEWFTPEDLGRNSGMRISGSRRKITLDGVKNSSARVSPKGAIILSTRAPIGHLAVIEVAAATNQGCRSLVPISKVNSCFLYYSLLASRYVLQSLGKGSTFMELTSDDLGSHSLPLPPLSEQRVIAEFLDRETARVDALVEKKQQLIERLAEYRTALITQTVTKGLPPDVAAAEGFNPASSLKPSGVEWLGDVPEHWEVKRLGDIADLVSGYPFDSVYFDRNEGFPLIRMGDLYKDETEMNWSGQLISEALVDTGDILVGISGEFNVSMWSHGPALLNQRICCIRSHYRIVNQRLIYYCLLIQLMLVNDTIYSTTIKNLSLSELRKLSIPVPPIQEQRVIAEFLDRETERIDALSARVETAIERLAEYRTALITAAVTGKIDVQGFVGVETADIGTVAK